VEPLAPHEKIFIDTDMLEDENHGSIECQECHGGNPNDPNWKTAHKGVVKDPTYPNPEKACGDCHPDIVANSKTSLHVSLKPFDKIIAKRAGKNCPAMKGLKKGQKNHCSKCHSSCGQCHISRPNSVDGGLLDGHIYQKRPPMKEVCTACHGSRIGKEYFGENKGLKPDTHHERYMKCGKCHSGDEMHGDGKEYKNRYAVKDRPSCVKCHKKIFTKKSKSRKTHRLHKNKLSCQVCHSQSYKNCSSCHVRLDKNKLPAFKTDKSKMAFKIGLNPIRSKDRPEKYVTVRHAPVSKKTFDFYEKDALKNFDSLPTWKYATPHNIRRKTKQNKSCNSCHGNKKLFLTKEDVVPEERTANKNVIVPDKKIPGRIK